MKAYFLILSVSFSLAGCATLDLDSAEGFGAADSTSPAGFAARDHAPHASLFGEPSPSRVDRSPARETPFQEAAGLEQEDPRFRSPPPRYVAQRSADVRLGMLRQDVRDAWGEPREVEVAGDHRSGNERWIYRRSFEARVVYFESGRVVGWESQ